MKNFSTREWKGSVWPRASAIGTAPATVEDRALIASSEVVARDALMLVSDGPERTMIISHSLRRT
jgi:hypothetical protein